MGTMTDEGAERLLASANSLRRLKSLDLSRNYLSPAICERLQSALPNVMVHVQKQADGEWRYVSTRDSEEYWFRGCFHEVRPNELIVQTFTFEGFPDGVSLERLELEDLGDGRTRLVATSLVDSFEGLDAFVASGMETGVQEGYRKLDRILAGL